ncbi:TIGR03915 family putative DNA repair protein [Alteromonas oceanisediminis]|uniref:TIGR03915 family putative DNA repair protein n=1 Tax=Alteromonas oceanisediminis TaxID=2836180 RepID=UPI001BD92D12|nr:TIGR03915 family putative DNA repair protein [Alteromonas oceanisediminis]MBT0587041.1 TIGR03915 family putative DNA repair protein [Alteromonas oceanisediminis]
MKTISINSVPGYSEWRTASRECLAQSIAPEHIVWQGSQSLQDDLFGDAEQSPGVCEAQTRHRIPNSVLVLFNYALCHRDTSRFALCYRVLWRVIFENKNLIELKTDKDVLHLYTLAKAVKRDAYKMSAFLRFRGVTLDGQEHFIAWYEPEHYSLEIKLDFFKTRFKNMRWSILTPYRAAHWDTEKLILEDNPDPSVFPEDDRIEKYWLTYYANIFNPARIKKDAMLSSMPKKYWKNMPETALIDDMIRESDTRARRMINDGSKQTPKR